MDDKRRVILLCGICGFTGNGKIDVLRKMTDLIHHRGPDEEGFYSDDHIKLGSRRLSIIDIFTGQQPVHNEDETIWCVFNGEIYNFQELRKKLVERGHRFYTDHSDTEVLVHLYEEFGLDFVDKLNGMFAIALWDKKEEKLVLIRDRMGVKPLFYAYLKGNFIFSSEIKSILAHPDYKKEINYHGIYHYFSFKNVPAPLTAFKEIYSVNPGEMIIYKHGKVEKKRYWKIRFHERYDYTQEEVEARILELLRDAVKIRMVSDVPVGAYLSGGLDSSTVVALMSHYASHKIKTFSLGYQNQFLNKEEDLLFARKVADYYGTEHYEYMMSSKELSDEIDNVLKSFDQPFSGTISTYFLSRLIKKHVKVALSGDGADEQFGSYLSHRLAQPMYYFSIFYQQYKEKTLTQEHRKLLMPFEENLEYLERLYIDSHGDDSKWRYHLLPFNDQEKHKLLSKDYLKVVQGDSTARLLDAYFQHATTEDPLNRMLEFDWNVLLPDQVLAFVDFLSMAHSVEVRSPFLDYRLVEFVATIPGSMKIKQGNVKDILKKAVKTILPDGITQRPKEGFVLPNYQWMSQELKPYVLSVLTKENIKKHGLLECNEVLSLVNEYYGGNHQLASKIWNILMFQIWWNNYFE